MASDGNRNLDVLCSFVFFNPCGIHRSSEYHEGAAWRARGPPMTVTEARTQYLRVTGAQLYGGLSYLLRSRPDYPAGRCDTVAPSPSDNMLLCFVPYVQPGSVSHSGWLVTVIGAYNHRDVQHAGPRLLMSVSLYFDMSA